MQEIVKLNELINNLPIEELEGLLNSFIATNTEEEEFLKNKAINLEKLNKI